MSAPSSSSRAVNWHVRVGSYAQTTYVVKAKTAGEAEAVVQDLIDRGAAIQAGQQGTALKHLDIEFFDAQIDGVARASET